MTCLSRAALALTALWSTALAGNFPANLKLVNLNEPSGFRLDGVAAQDFSGAGMPGGGNFNGDGIDDLMIGSLGPLPRGNYAGSNFVVHGWFPREAVTRVGSAASRYASGGFQVVRAWEAEREWRGKGKLPKLVAWLLLGAGLQINSPGISDVNHQG